LAEHILNSDENLVFEKVMAAAHKAEKLGVNIIGFGALAGTVGEGAKKIADNLLPPITNGTSYAACAIIDSINKAARIKNINLPETNLAIIGATNAIGVLCAKFFANKVRRISLAAKNAERLKSLCQKIGESYGAEVSNCATDVASCVKGADIVIFTTTAIEVSPDISKECLKNGAIICDIPAPRNVSRKVYQQRQDLFIIDAAVIDLPLGAQIKINTGLRPGQSYACMAETMILALEGRFEDFSFGWEPSLDKVEIIRSLAAKHGFKPSFTRFGEKIL
jgi:fatty aldehyde-generating acyl-ACP reductase